MSVIFYLILVPVVLYVLLKLYEYSCRRQVYNVKTGELIPSESILSLWSFLLFGGKNQLYFQDWIGHLIKGNDVFGVFMGPKMFVSVSDHKLGKQVLQETDIFTKDNSFLKENPILNKLLGVDNVVFTNGEQWMKQRHAINPAFYTIEIYTDAFKEKSKMILDSIAKDRDNGVVHDVSNFMQRMTLDVLGKTIFDHDFKSIEGSIQQDLEAYNYVISNGLTIKQFLFGSLLQKVGDGQSIKVMKSIDVLDTLLVKLIDEAKKKLEQKEPKLSMLEHLVEASMTGEITQEELRNNILVFFVAGHETTSTALSYAITLLAQHPDIQEKLRKEIIELIPDGNITFQALKNCEYLDAVIKETMRRFPPLQFIPGKLVAKDTQLGDWFLPKGSVVQVNAYGIQHDAKVFGDPFNYRPERWLKAEQAKNKIPSSAWIPFSAGSRVCVGNNFSLLEQKVFLADLVTRFKFEKLDPEEVRPSGSFGLPGPKKADIKFTELKK